MKLETLQKDMIAAMKTKDKEKKDSIATLVSAVKRQVLMQAAERIFRRIW